MRVAFRINWLKPRWYECRLFIKFDKPEPTDVRRIFIFLLFLSFYFFSLAKGGIQIKAEPYFNWITIWLSFFFGVLFTIFFRLLNKISRKTDQRSNPGLPMNGWIIFLGINLAVRIGIQAYFFWTANYFLYSAWISKAHAGGVKLQTVFILEMFLSLFALAGTGALLYWLIGKRDIFPAMFVYYVGFYLLATFLLIVIYQNMTLPGNMISIRHNMSINIARIVYAAAWVIFVLKSQRVKQTFVYPPG